MRLRFILLGFLAFVAALLVVFPAAWIKGLLPAQVSCASISGSIWNGQCSGLALSQPGKPPVQLDALSWQLQPLSLLRGRVQADVSAAGPGLAASGRITARSGGYLELSGLSGTLLLDHARLAALPAGWSAQAEGRDITTGISAGRITVLGGVLLARQLRDSRGTAYGDFKLEFPRQQTPPFRGTLTDDSGASRGPMQLQSQLSLNADRSWQLRGTVMLRPGGPQELAGALDRLAPADLNGVRNFSLEGTAN